MEISCAFREGFMTMGRLFTSYGHFSVVKIQSRHACGPILNLVISRTLFFAELFLLYTVCTVHAWL